MGNKGLEGSTWRERERGQRGWRRRGEREREKEREARVSKRLYVDGFERTPLWELSTSSIGRDLQF